MRPVEKQRIDRGACKVLPVVISGTGYASGGMKLDGRFTDVFPLDDRTYNAHKNEVERLRKAVRKK